MEYGIHTDIHDIHDIANDVFNLRGHCFAYPDRNVFLAGIWTVLCIKSKIINRSDTP